jgi:hypothetical protein
MGDKIKYLLLLSIILLFIFLWINGCLIMDKHQYLENSKKIKTGMGINEVIKTMGNAPYNIFEYEDNVNSSRLKFFYFDKKTETEISISLNDSLKVIMVGFDS